MFDSFKTPSGKVSHTKLILIVGVSIIMLYAVRYLERMLGLPDDLFVKVIPYVAGIITALTMTLSALYGWSKKIDVNKPNAGR